MFFGSDIHKNHVLVVTAAIAVATAYSIASVAATSVAVRSGSLVLVGGVQATLTIPNRIAPIMCFMTSIRYSGWCPGPILR